ncbi:hypothetical protein ES708_23623 [subsurface metagenome]
MSYLLNNISHWQAKNPYNGWQQGGISTPAGQTTLCCLQAIPASNTATGMGGQKMGYTCILAKVNAEIWSLSVATSQSMSMLRMANTSTFISILSLDV